MKNLYYIISLFMLLTSVSLYSQDRVYAPNLTFPEDSETGLSPDVTLDWNAVTGETLTVLYELQLSNTSDFVDAVTFPKTEVTAMEMEDLFFGTLYFWRVKAYDGEEISDWSEAWSFTTATSIEMDDPADGEMVFADPNITWDEMTGLLKYQIQIDTSYIWNSVTLETSEDILSSFIIDENNMWLVGTSGLVLHYDGSLWNTVDAGTTEDLNDIYFVDASNGFIAGTGGTFLIYDGTNWTSVDPGVTDNLNGVAFLDADNGYLVGDDGLILQYASGTFTTEIAKDENGDDITKDFYDIDVIDANNYWACGKSKYIVNYDGSTWTGGVVGGKDHYAIWFNNANDGWVASKSGRVQHFDGTDWTETETDGDNLFSISFDGGIGYAVGKNGTMIVFDGEEWTLITAGTAETLNTVYLKDGNGIAGGDGGTFINKSGEGFNSPYAKVISVIPDSTNYDMTNLLFGKSFYYRMRGIHSIDTSAWSSAKSMITYPYPEPDSPSDGSDDEQLRIVFEWEEYSGVTRYYLSVSPNEDFLPAFNFPSDSNSYQLNDFEFGEQYYWRVRAEHSEDISDWSDVYTFTTLNTIELLSPENNATDVNKCPKFKWEEVLGSTGYELWVDTDDNFSNPTVFITEDNFNQCQSSMDEGASYFWKVRGIAGLDTSNWSPDWTFKVESVGIDDIFNQKSLEIYPNPSTGEFTLDINSIDAAIYHISISDMGGKTIYTTEFNCKQGNNQIELDLSGSVTNGAYMINVSRENITVNKRLFIK